MILSCLIDVNDMFADFVLISIGSTFGFERIGLAVFVLSKAEVFRTETWPSVPGGIGTGSKAGVGA